jgi:hypothetical protein
MSPRRFVAVLATVVAALSGALLFPSDQSAAPTGSSFPGGPAFAIGCGVSHRNTDDPIVYPGRPGRSHNHTYFGNRKVDASTKPSSLVGGPTSCQLEADSSAYWVPTSYLDRVPVYPAQAIAYYVRRTAGTVESYPAGLVMIAGNATAHHRQPKGIVAWSCTNYNPLAGSFVRVGAPPLFNAAPACGRDRFLQLRVTFPSCWNGTALDSSDHKRHMAYASSGRCPASHPRALPTLALVVLYPPVSKRARLASSHFGGHADFMNGWNPGELAELVSGIN